MTDHRYRSERDVLPGSRGVETVMVHASCSCGRWNQPHEDDVAGIHAWNLHVDHARHLEHVDEINARNHNPVDHSADRELLTPAWHTFWTDSRARLDQRRREEAANAEAIEHMRRAMR